MGLIFVFIEFILVSNGLTDFSNLVVAEYFKCDHLVQVSCKNKKIKMSVGHSCCRNTDVILTLFPMNLSSLMVGL
jgi:hypothetical protein